MKTNKSIFKKQGINLLFSWITLVASTLFIIWWIYMDLSRISLLIFVLPTFVILIGNNIFKKCIITAEEVSIKSLGYIITTFPTSTIKEIEVHHSHKGKVKSVLIRYAKDRYPNSFIELKDMDYEGIIEAIHLYKPEVKLSKIY